ncbi:VMA21-like domain-containing protein [Phthorimaea operculella]|nr:VMA21-like domain-containing protein [Phthorimaea operculella]
MNQTQEEEKSDLQLLQAIVKYVILLSSIPVLTFFVSKLVVFDLILAFEQTQSSVYSAILAVIVLHIALGHYIYKAYYEAEKAPKEKKAD